MQELDAVVLESWDRQVRIIDNLVNALTEAQMPLVSREGEWPISHHLAHIHSVRVGWLHDVNPCLAQGLSWLHTEVAEGDWQPTTDFQEIKEHLPKSAKAVRDAVAQGIQTPGPVGPYSHPIFFMQHMIWHEGWHTSSIIHALRANGQEMSEEWEEANIWAVWRS